MQHISLKGALAVLVVLLLASLVLGQVSVPNQINFQGRLTDASGNPVADGSHTVNFTLWTLPVGGSNVWTENTTQTTGGGLFTHNLGSLTAFSSTLFENNDSLYLQIQADGQTITPRIRLTSAPYARSANNLEVCGSDLLPNIQTGGTSFGEIWLRDSDPSNFLGVNVGAYSNGGAIDLHDNAGSTVISLDAGASGDASAILPDNAINAAEISNEPGVSNSIASLFVTLGSGNIGYVVDSVDITIPSAGYVEITAGCYLNLWHETGTATNLEVAIDKTRANASYTFPGAQVARVPGSLATNLWQMPCTTTRLYSEVVAGPHRYYLNVDYVSGTSISTNIAQGYIRATYYPTLYGTVTIAATSEENNVAAISKIPSDGSQPAPRTELTTITVEEHNARLEAEVAKIKAELNARLQKIEQQLNKTKQAGVEE